MSSLEGLAIGRRRQFISGSECDSSRRLWQRERQDITSHADSDANFQSHPNAESVTNALAKSNPNALSHTDSLADRRTCGDDPMRAAQSMTQSIARSFALLLFAALPVVAPIAGCGSSSSKVGTTGASATTRSTATGRATFTFLWPKRTTGRLIPVNANSIQVKVIAADGAVAATQLIARPASGATSATVTFDNLIVGTYTIIASAFPNADGSGNAQAQAQTSATILQGQTTPFTLTLASTIANLSLAASSTTLIAGQTVTLIPTATDAAGKIVLVSPSTLQWSSSTPSIATVNANGAVSAISAGSATISVTETESGKSTSVTFSVSTAASSSLPKATTFHINASHTGSIAFGQTLNFPSSPTWRVNLGGPISYPVIAGGKVFVTVGPNTDPAIVGPRLYALDAATGRTVWGPVTLTAATVAYAANLTYDNGKLFAVNGNGLIESFDAATGAPGWSAQLQGQPDFSEAPNAANGILYVVGMFSGGTTYAVDEKNGNVLWTQSVAGETSGSPTVGQDASGNSTGVYVSYPCSVYGYNPSTGAPLWHNGGICAGDGGSAPVYSSGSLYVRDALFQIYDAITGASTGNFSTILIPAINTTTGFFVTRDAPDYVTTLHGIDLASKNVLWSFTGNRDLVSEPIVIDQTVIIGGSYGTIYALDALTGTQKWSGSINAPLTDPERIPASPMKGISAGEGYLVVPSDFWLTAWHIAGQ